MIHFITSYVIIPANPQQPIHCPKCNRWSFIDSDRLAKSKISGGFSPPSPRGKMIVGEWVRHLGGWHSQYDGKVIIQPCSSHQQPEEYHVISNPNISPILIQYCSSYTPNKFFRCGPQEVIFSESDHPDHQSSAKVCLQAENLSTLSGSLCKLRVPIWLRRGSRPMMLWLFTPKLYGGDDGLYSDWNCVTCPAQ